MQGCAVEVDESVYCNARTVGLSGAVPTVS